MLISYKRGQGSVIVRVKIFDSSVTTGAGKTGLTNVSGGLIISTIADNEATATVYTSAASNVETVTALGTYSAPTASKCRFKEVDATNHKGIYEIQFADARFAVANAKGLLISISGVANAAECDAVIPLRDLDPYDSVRAGLTALPNAAAAASGGLIINGGNSGTVTLAAFTVTGATIHTGNVTLSDGLTITRSTAGQPGMIVTGNTSGAGLRIVGGASGRGIDVETTSGNGIHVSCVTQGHAFVLTGAGTGDGLRIIPGVTGHGINANGGATSGDAIRCTVTSGIELNADITGNITGNLSGSVGSVTTISAGAISSASFVVGAIDAAAMATDALGAAEFSQAAADKIWASATRTLTAFGFSVTVGTNNDKTGYALTAGERNSIADAYLDRASAIDGKTPRQALQYTAATVAGKLSGSQTNTETFVGIDGVTTRVTITVDSSGNRTAIVYN